MKSGEDLISLLHLDPLDLAFVVRVLDFKVLERGPSGAVGSTGPGIQKPSKATLAFAVERAAAVY